MDFCSLDFIFIFLPIVVICHKLVDDYLKNAVLMLSSVIFYCFAVNGHYEWLLFLVISAVFYFVMGKVIAKSKGKQRKTNLWIGAIFGIVMLVFFKYGGAVFGTSLSPLFAGSESDSGAFTLLLPLGISFYSFKNVSYLHEVYKKDVPPAKSFVNYAAYIMMFPEVISGPIQTYKSFRPYMRRSVTSEQINEGLSEFIIGFALKQMLANRLGSVWSGILRIGYDGISTPLAWFGVISFSLQLYFDFYGYSLMAVGIGKMLGYEIPKNFDHPYMSKSVGEFWRRWHITLGDWFKENIYFPLGGNRVDKKIKVYRNLLAVWIVTGLWHGSTWNYLIWGLFLFAFIALERTGKIDFIIKNNVLSHIYAVFIIVISWMIFKLENLSDIPVYLSRMFPLFTETPTYVDKSDIFSVGSGLWVNFFAAIVFATSLPRKIYDRIKDKKWIVVPLLAVLFWYSVYLAACSSNDPFMYGNY